MNPTTFDALTKALATRTSRREALKAIAATTLGSILGLSGIGTALAKCKPAGDKCNHDHQCCSGLVCQHGQCVTPTYPYTCTCNNDFPAQHSTCSPDDCTQENLTVVCTSLCVSHGGYEGSGNCNNTPC